MKVANARAEQIKRTKCILDILCICLENELFVSEYISIHRNNKVFLGQVQKFFRLISSSVDI